MTNEELNELEFCTQNVCFLTDEFEATNDKGTILTLRNFGKLAEIFFKEYNLEEKYTKLLLSNEHLYNDLVDETKYSEITPAKFILKYKYISNNGFRKLFKKYGYAFALSAFAVKEMIIWCENNGVIRKSI